MIIGITGTIAAGKGTVAEILSQKGFLHLSVREFLIEEIKRRSLPVNRDTMKEVADDLRKTKRPSYILEQLYHRAGGKDAVLESIRSSREVQKLRELGGFVLLAVNADRNLRFQRLKERASESDHIDYRTFVEHEEREMEGKEAFEMDIRRCLEMADHTIWNEGDLEELRTKVDGFLESVKNEED